MLGDTGHGGCGLNGGGRPPITPSAGEAFQEVCSTAQDDMPCAAPFGA